MGYFKNLQIEIGIQNEAVMKMIKKMIKQSEKRRVKLQTLLENEEKKLNIMKKLMKHKCPNCGCRCCELKIFEDMLVLCPDCYVEWENFRDD